MLTVAVSLYLSRTYVHSYATSNISSLDAQFIKIVVSPYISSTYVIYIFPQNSSQAVVTLSRANVCNITGIVVSPYVTMTYDAFLDAYITSPKKIRQPSCRDI